jgi:hypothetical protein
VQLDLRAEHAEGGALAGAGEELHLPVHGRRREPDGPVRE